MEELKRQGKYIAYIEQDDIYNRIDYRADTEPLGTIYGKNYHRHIDISDASATNPHELDKNDIAVIMPVFMLDHSGQRFSCTDNFNWLYMGMDSGTIAHIYCTKEDVRKWYGVNRLTKSVLQRARQQLIHEVEDLDAISIGDVWYISVEDTDGTEYDGCGGILGYDNAVKEADSMLNYLVQHDNTLYKLSKSMAVL